jgi:hypothetical protein
MATTEIKDCDGCKHCSIRDYGYGQYEIHDYYCWLHHIWGPTRCEDYDGEEE